MQPTIDQLFVSDATLAHFFLDRLAATVVRQTVATSLQERTALTELTFALYLDCLDLGLGLQAQSIMEQGCSEIAPAERAVA